jgi:DNA mismatch repair protein MutS
MFNDIINPDKNIIDEYFRIYNIYSNKYGKINTLLFLQVGSFYEAYQTLDDGYELQKISDLLNIIVSKKNKSIIEISNKNPLMLGFPLITLNKFLKILIENDYTVVIGEQITPPPNPKRAITGVYSPGTYLENTNPDTNNIMSIYIEDVSNDKSGTNLIIGLSILDLTVGKSIIHEVYTNNDDDKLCLDEVTKFMYTNQVKEIIITTHNLNSGKFNDIMTYLEIADKIYHHQTINQKQLKLSYQQETLRKVYPNVETLTPIEYLDLENLSYGRISFILLLNYAYDHSHNIINNISRPEIYNDIKFLDLGNNAISQLNLINVDKNNITGIYNEKTHYKSLFDVLNKTSTPMGRRMLKENLSRPLIDINEINIRYNFISEILSTNFWEKIELGLIGINDIERYSRKITLGILNPSDFFNWIESISNCITLLNNMLIHNISLSSYDNCSILIDINDMLATISKHIAINELSKYHINDIYGPIFNKGIYKDVDRLCNNINKCINYMDALSWGLSNFLDNYLQNGTCKPTNVFVSNPQHISGTNDNLIKVEYNERDGHFLILTKRRAEVLEQLLNKHNIIKFTYNDNDYVIKKEELTFKHLPKGNNSKIFIREMGKNSSHMLEYQNELKMLQKEYYVKILVNISSKYSSLISILNKYIATLDYLKAGAKVAVKYHYSIPTIEKISNKSYFKAIELRHPIIELLNIDSAYIPSNIELGTEKQDGILLFGLNSSGKSSLQKSIGIALIMAQMGYPVAAKEFVYYPYHYLFTRISSNDNIFKGLSSFALEMSELRAIIKRSDDKTLVIADEVCKGTEHMSSLIIVLTMLEILSMRRTSFITATHLHDLVSIERLKNLNNIKQYHLHVEYDEINNTIIYDRILKEGSGDNFYGLNVAKYLIADQKFMNLANNIKKDIFELPNLLTDKTSNYNSNLYMTACQICGYIPKKNEIPLETHHIIFQKNFINGINKAKFHLQKNHKSNLVVLCNKCHDDIDTKKISINGWISSTQLDWSRNDG